jgi:chromosome segregation ATPase
LVQQSCSALIVEELRSTRELITKYNSERSDYEQRLAKLASEMEELQTAAAIAEVGKEDEVAKAQRQHHEELASFQQILEGSFLSKGRLKGKALVLGFQVYFGWWKHLTSYCK